MKKLIVASIAFAGLTACVKVLPTDSGDAGVETVQLRATITPDNHCTVDIQGKTYSSVGQVRGATLPSFVGVTNEAYHEVACWVGNVDGSDGNIAVSFSGNSFQKPFAVGTFLQRFEAPAATDDKFATVTFQGSVFPGRLFRTDDNGAGTVVVESGANGERTIHIDVVATKLFL
jgi:hypothetical protein